MNYRSQTDSISCGPIALINTLIWCGIPGKQIKSLTYYKKLTQCHRTKNFKGTHKQHLFKAFKKLEKDLGYFVCEEVKADCPIPEDLKLLLDDKAVSVVIDFPIHLCVNFFPEFKEQWFAHYITIFKQGKYLYATNLFSKNLLRLNKKLLTRILAPVQTRDQQFPWFIVVTKTSRR